MDILISRQGQQTGPYSDEDALALVRTGQARLSDMAWRPGMGDWLPLEAVLGIDSNTVAANTTAAETVVPPTPKPEPSKAESTSAAGAEQLMGGEAATQRQKAFLTFLGMPFSTELTKERAALMLNDALEDPKKADRIKRWDHERLRLYPDIFAEELKAQKENRAQHFLEACQKEGSVYFDGVTKAHTQVLVGYLDVHHPNWDHHEESVQYFFAAVSEKFPQLVKKQAKGQLKYPDGRMAREFATNKRPPRAPRRRSPVGAAIRGVILGLLVLGALYGANEYYELHRTEVKKLLGRWMPDAELAGVEPEPAKPADDVVGKAAKPESTDAASESTAAAAPAPIPTPAPLPAGSPAELGTAPASTAMVAPPMAAMAGTPEAMAPSASASSATPTPAPAPGAPVLPGLFEMPTAATPAPATPAPRTSITITKATSVPLKFGVSTLSAGTSVPFVSVEGANALIRFGSEVVRVPLANTDFEPGR